MMWTQEVEGPSSCWHRMKPIAFFFNLPATQLYSAYALKQTDDVFVCFAIRLCSANLWKTGDLRRNQSPKMLPGHIPISPISTVFWACKKCLSVPDCAVRRELGSGGGTALLPCAGIKFRREIILYVSQGSGDKRMDYL